MESEKIYWHDAFFAALQLELDDYADVLSFEAEHQLSKEALEIDVLVIKKKANTPINKNIGRMFKGRNLFEYKSEKDNLSVWDYNKVFGYAMLYSAFEEIPVNEITISFVVTQKPVKLLAHLESDRSFTVSESHLGIYYIKGDTFSVQIIESKKLTAAENVFLKNLRSNLTKADMEEVFDAFKKHDELEKVNAYLNRILDANKSVLEEVLTMGGAAVQEILNRHIQKNGVPLQIETRIRGEAQEEKARDTALEMFKRGFSLEEIADIIKKPLDWVQNLISQ